MDANIYVNAHLTKAHLNIYFDKLNCSSNHAKYIFLYKNMREQEYRSYQPVNFWCNKHNL